MKKLNLCIIILLLLKPDLEAQNITLINGFQELQLGISGSQVEEIIGFKGEIISRQEYLDTQLGDRDPSTLPAYQNNFDECILYNHIMPIPVTKVFLRENKVISIEINSFPSFSRPICLESQTSEGITFWDTMGKMTEIYGEDYQEVNVTEEYNIYYYYSRGIGFGLTNNEIRIIYFFGNE